MASKEPYYRLLGRGCKKETGLAFHGEYMLVNFNPDLKLLIILQQILISAVFFVAVPGIEPGQRDYANFSLVS